MATFTISQLATKEHDYTLADSDLILGSIGSNTAELSSVKISLKQFTNQYVLDNYTANNAFIVSGAPFGVNSNGGDVANGGNIPVDSYASLFETGGSGETSTLPNGTYDGQIKLLAMKTDGGGNMVVTITNRAGSGTLTFADAGDTALLQWIIDKWYVISTNGI